MTCKCFSFINPISTSYLHFCIYYVYHFAECLQVIFFSEFQNKIQDYKTIYDPYSHNDL